MSAQRIFQSYVKTSPFSEARPWTPKVTNSSRLQPINLIQRLVVKLTNLSDVRVIGKGSLSAVAENWSLAWDWVARIWLEVNNFFTSVFPANIRSAESWSRTLLISSLSVVLEKKTISNLILFPTGCLRCFHFLRNVFIQYSNWFIYIFTTINDNNNKKKTLNTNNSTHNLGEA